MCPKSLRVTRSPSTSKTRLVTTPSMCKSQRQRKRLAGGERAISGTLERCALTGNGDSAPISDEDAVRRLRHVHQLRRMLRHRETQMAEQLATRGTIARARVGDPSAAGHAGACVP